jgi:hypothetical protein
MTAWIGFGRRRWTVVATSVLVILLSACASQAKTAEPKQIAPSLRKVVLASVRTTAAAKSARMSLSMVAAGTGAEHFGVTAEGVTDFTTGDGVLTMQLGGADSAFPSGSVEMRIVDGTAYMKMPESLGGLFGSGKWLKIPDLAGAEDALPGLGQSDPSQFLASLETVSDGVKKVGSEPIRGVDTIHYRASLDLDKVVDRADAPLSLRDELRNLFGKGKSASAIPADVWVDANGLARRMQLQMDLGALTGDAAGSGDDAPKITVSMDLYDFGVPVHVVAPPSVDVTEFPGGSTGTVS